MLLQLINQTLVTWMVYKIHYTRKFQANLRNLGLHSKLTQLIENCAYYNWRAQNILFWLQKIKERKEKERKKEYKLKSEKQAQKQDKVC